MSAVSGDAETYAGADHDGAWRRLVAPASYRNPVPQDRYHLAVIGAGPAGLVTAMAAAGLGAKVALIEGRAMGGDCLNVGCVPSKALLEVTRRSGVAFDEAFEWLRAVRARLAAHDSVERYTQAGVDVFLGWAELAGANELRVAGRPIRARRIVIATGSRPELPPIPGLAESRPLTNETVFDLRHCPGRLAVLGAGPIGCELAQAFARLGVRVALIEAAARVLPGETVEASQAVAAALERAHVEIRLGARVERVERHTAGIHLQLADAEVAADELVVAAGRGAKADRLDLAAAGVDVDTAGRIVVDEYLRTRNRRIFAAGDVCSSRQFTHQADAQARIVVQNALFAPTAKATRLIIPRCTYTDPEVAAIGRTRAELAATVTPFDVHRVAFGSLDRGAAQDDREGFVEVLAARGRDTILGATVVGRDAGEQLAPLAVAMSRGLGLGSFASVVLPYPTRAEYLRRLADGYNRGRLTPSVRRLLKLWFRWCR